MPVLVSPRRFGPGQGGLQSGLQQGAENRVLRIDRPGVGIGDEVVEGPGVLGQRLAPVGRGGDGRRSVLGQDGARSGEGGDEGEGGDRVQDAGSGFGTPPCETPFARKPLKTW